MKLTWIEILLLVILLVIVVMIVWSLFGPSFMRWLSEFWLQINQPAS